MSVDSLANETGQARDYLEKVEKDEVIPPVAVLLTLGRALEVDSGELLKDDEAAETAQRRAQAVRTRTDHYSYRVLTPEALHKHLKGFRVTIEPVRRPGRPRLPARRRRVCLMSCQARCASPWATNINDLKAGDSLHFNSGVTHTLRQQRKRNLRAGWWCSIPPKRI